MVKTIFNLLIRYQIRKILFSLVEDKIHIFVRPSPVITSVYIYMYPISIDHLFSNKYFQLCHWFNAKNGLFMVLELNCMY